MFYGLSYCGLIIINLSIQLKPWRPSFRFWLHYWYSYDDLQTSFTDFKRQPHQSGRPGLGQIERQNHGNGVWDNALHGTWSTWRKTLLYEGRYVQLRSSDVGDVVRKKSFLRTKLSKSRPEWLPSRNTWGQLSASDPQKRQQIHSQSSSNAFDQTDDILLANRTQQEDNGDGMQRLYSENWASICKVGEKQFISTNTVIVS